MESPIIAHFGRKQVMVNALHDDLQVYGEENLMKENKEEGKMKLCSTNK
jgi:hypothetical protein